MLTRSFSAVVHLEKALFTARFKMWPIPNLPFIVDIIIISSNNTFYVRRFGKIHIFGNYLEPRENIIRFLVVLSNANCLTGVHLKFGHFIMIFMDYHFF